ncbi:MAG: PDZ domain-containing protein [Parasphingorhabdus sp.]
MVRNKENAEPGTAGISSIEEPDSMPYSKQLGYSAIISSLLCISFPSAAKNIGLARYPDIHQDQITFAYADKIWIANANGGAAKSLTEFGTELSRPKFSTDGSQIAFSAKVDGNLDIYVIPAAGGEPKRITHHPAKDYALDWSPDGTGVLFASTMSSPRAVYNQLHIVPAQGGLPKKLPVPYGETATYANDGKTILYSYLRDFQEEAWKRYRGGRAPDLWSYDPVTGSGNQLTNHEASDSTPMQVGDAVYYLTERDDNGRSNIWRLGQDGQEPVQVTHFTDTDVRRPSADGRQIIFEAGGQLYRLDPSTKSSPERISLSTEMDMVKWKPKQQKVADRISNAAINGDGDVVIEARGDIFRYKGRKKNAANITQSSGSAERYPQISADGRVAYFSDSDGEYALYVRSSDGVERKVADFGPGLRYNPYWSPDGKRVALMDYQQVLWLVDIETGIKTRVDQGKWWFHWDLGTLPIAWSPDSRWISYANGLDNRNHAIFAYEIETARKHQLTSGLYNDFSPVFDDSGNYLMFLSNRNFSATYGDFIVDATWTYTNSVAAVILPLNPAVPSPGSEDWAMPGKPERVTISPRNAERRLALLGAKPGNIAALAATDDGYALLRQGDRSQGTKSILEKYVFGSDKPVTLQEETQLSLASAAGPYMLTKADKKLFIVNTAKKGKVKALKTDGLTATVDRQAEYRQMFADAWRYPRDFYYDPTIHGVDWNAVRSRYEALLPYAYIDDDLTFIVREMEGELEGGHVYASATAPRRRSDADNVGLLGIDFVPDGDVYRVGKIIRTGNRHLEHHSPLDDPALAINEGTVILAVNDKPITTATNPWQPFEGLADKTVELRIASSPDGSDARTVKVKTLKSERKLRELVWVEENRKKVEKASGGRIGYIYVPNTGREGQNELMIQYRSQIDKDALIIDERFNTGGALGDRFVELLNRPPLIYFRARNSTSYPLPENAFRGPKAMLINGWSYSGGDGFPLLFKTAKLGPLIGERTWGGLIGPGLSLPLINGGFISAPPIRVATVNGKWAEGNEGVRPNIEVANDPAQLANGVDQQLDRAIAEMMKQLENYQPVPAPEFQKAGEWNPDKRSK